MRFVSRAALLLGAVLVLLVPTVAAFSLFPDAHSQIAREWRSLFTTIFWAALVVFVLVEGLLLYALVRFRRRPHGPQEGPHIHGNTKMEIAWTIAPTLVMAWLLVISLQALDRTDHGPDPAFEVDVIGSQFQWSFGYPPDYSNTTTKTLYVEEGKVVGLRVTSFDVIHAFNVPSLGVMIDAVPGKINHAWFKADEPGEYFAQCRELCGVGHGKMHATVVVFAAGSQERPWGLPPSNETTPPPINTTTPGNTTAPTPDRTEKVILGAGGALTITPKDVSVDPGTKLLLQVENQATFPHNLYVGKAYDTSLPDNGASAKTADLATQGATADLFLELPTEPGAYEWWCNIEGHYDAGMHGSLLYGGTLGGGNAPLLPGFGTPLLLVGGLLGGLLAARRRT